ncbi:MAG TPA: hypothetical protein VGP32_08345 [Steroidobacteraceae bacterium]|jgi:hypothetical protein|nr:hypothetical protein [Steroidobacteraceae bacterium]
MNGPFSHPWLIFVLSFAMMSLCAVFGARVLGIRFPHDKDAREDFDIVLAAALTLLGLIIGFTFSMAVSRFEQRKNYEEDEANAIGTEYTRAGLLAAADTTKVRALLKSYVDERILYYQTRDAGQLRQIDARTQELQAQLWSAVEAPVRAGQPNPILALVVSGMNDVLNSQSYTQAAWWNRIPPAAWGLMVLIALLCNMLLGVRASRLKQRGLLLEVLPVMLSVAFLLIADIDSPRGGYIHVRPLNLMSLAASLR